MIRATIAIALVLSIPSSVIAQEGALGIVPGAHGFSPFPDQDFPSQAFFDDTYHRSGTRPAVPFEHLHNQSHRCSLNIPSNGNYS